MKNKELLLKDLCARFPYKVMAKYYDPEDECETWDEIEGIDSSGRVEIGQYYLPIERIKPYLFPLSSMTEEELIKFLGIRGKNLNSDELKTFRNEKTAIATTLPLYSRHIDWLNAHHFDYRGLIEKSLALDATGLNIY